MPRHVIVLIPLLLAGCNGPRREAGIDVFGRSQGRVILLVKPQHVERELSKTVADLHGVEVLAQHPTYVLQFRDRQEFGEALAVLGVCPAVASVAPDLPGHVSGSGRRPILTSLSRR